MDDREIFTDADGTRKRLLQAALSVLHESGYDGLSMAAIAEKAGIEKASIYHHYANKDELLFSFLRFTIEHVATRMATSADKTPIEQLRAAIDRAVLIDPTTGYADDHGPSDLIIGAHVQARAQAVHRSEYRDQMTELDTTIKMELTSIVRDATEQGYMYDDTGPEQLAETLLTFVTGAIQRDVTAENVDHHRIRDGIHKYIDQFVLPEYRHEQPASDL